MAVSGAQGGEGEKTSRAKEEGEGQAGQDQQVGDFLGLGRAGDPRANQHVEGEIVDPACE